MTEMVKFAEKYIKVGVINLMNMNICRKANNIKILKWKFWIKNTKSEIKNALKKISSQ